MATEETTATETTTATEAAEKPAQPENGAPAAAATTEAPAKTWEQEVEELAALAAKSAEATEEKPADPAEGEEKKPEGEKPADDQGEEKVEEKPAETEEKTEAKPQGDMARRLAMVAEGNRKNELRHKELDTREQQLAQRFKPLEELAGKLRAVGSDRSLVVQELLGGEDQLQEFYLELTERFHSGGDGEKKAPRKPAEKGLTQADVEKAVKAALEAEGSRQLVEMKASYVSTARRVLELSPDRFPLVFAAPPSDRGITDISDAILASTGEVPSVETVLETIENHRKERHAKASKKKADQTSPPDAKTAAADKPSKTSGEKPKQPVRQNNVPVVTAAPKSFDEEIADLAKKLNQASA